MLKIKKECMKDLEKFGFKKDDNYYSFDFDISNTLFVGNDDITKGDLYLSNECSSIPNVVYDLIKADMVEKVVNDSDGNK